MQIPRRFRLPGLFVSSSVRVLDFVCKEEYSKHLLCVPETDTKSHGLNSCLSCSRLLGFKAQNDVSYSIVLLCVRRTSMRRKMKQEFRRRLCRACERCVNHMRLQQLQLISS